MDGASYSQKISNKDQIKVMASKHKVPHAQTQYSGNKIVRLLHG